MFKLSGPNEGAGFFKSGHNLWVGIKHPLATKPLHRRQVSAVVINRVVDFQPFLQCQLIVFLTMPRRGMYAPGAGLKRDMLTQQDDRGPVIEWVLTQTSLKQRSREGCQHLAGNTGCRHELILQPLGNNQDLPVNRQGTVSIFRMQCNRQVSRNGPGGGGPDHHKHLVTGNSRYLSRNIVQKLKADIDGWRGMIGILNFSFSQRSNTGGTPVNRLPATVQPAVMGEGRQFRSGLPLIAIGHSEVRVLPVPQNTKAFKFITLDADKLLGILTAGFTHLSLTNGIFLRAEVLLNLQLNRQTMAIPARDIGSMEPLHPLDLQNDIFQGFVQGVANMNMTIGIGRSIMQDIGRPLRGASLKAAIQVQFSPALEHLRLTLEQVCLHRKIGFRKVQGLFVIHATTPMQTGTV